jgi:hypothetical protein
VLTSPGLPNKTIRRALIAISHFKDDVNLFYFAPYSSARVPSEVFEVLVSFAAGPGQQAKGAARILTALAVVDMSERREFHFRSKTIPDVPLASALALVAAQTVESYTAGLFLLANLSDRRVRAARALFRLVEHPRVGATHKIADAIRLAAEPTGHAATVWLEETSRLLEERAGTDTAIGPALIDALAALIVGRETELPDGEFDLGLPL